MKGSEINEEIEEKNKTGKSSMSISTFLSNFSRDYIEKRPANVKNQLIEELMIKDSLSGTLASKGLAEFRASDEKYSEVDIDDKNIDVYMLRKYVTKSYLLQEKSQKNFQEYVLEEYDISSEKYINKVESEAKQLSGGDLDRMIGGGSEIQKFLEKCLGAGKVQQRTNFNLLEGVTEKQFHDRLKKIKSPEREELSEILEKLQKNQTPRDDEIRAIVESSILDDKQKELFVHTFLPFINLQQAIDIGLKSQGEAEKIHKKYISTLLNGSDLSKENQEKVAEQISFSDIDVKTRDIVGSGSDAIKISEGIGFQKYVDDLDHNNQELLEQVRAHGPQSFQEMIVAIGAINQGNQYQNLQAFTPGNIVKFSKVGTDGEVQIDFVEIVSFDDQQKEFSFRNVGNDSINLKNPGESTGVEYQDFVEGLKEDSKTSFEVISRDVIQEKIKKGEIKSSSLTTLVAPDLEGEENFERRQEIKEKHIDELEREFSELEVKFSRAEDSQKKEIQRDLDKISKELAEFRDASDISAEHAAELYNRQEFLRKLDEVDSKGSSLGFGLGVAFRVGEKMLEGDFGTYTVRSIDYENWTVSFYGESGVEKDVDLTAFFENFKEKKATRHKSFNNPDELISGNEVFKNHEFKNGDIIAKNAEDGEGKSADRPVEFLRAKKGKKIIRISSLSGGYADVQIGETEDAKLTDAEKDRGDKKTNIKIKGAKTHTWTLDELHRFIEQEELEPDWKAGQTMTIVPQEHQNKFHGSFTNKFFKGMSIYDVIHGWKTVVEGITESLNQGSHVKSAHAALAMGAFLPEDLRQDLRSKVEAAESEEMDKVLKQLGSVDSPIAVGRIKKWLLNKDTPESKKEAGLLFMLDKYGHLTAKGPLAEYRGKFLWYEAFGGKIGDPLYNDIKERAESSEPPQTFSEEQLMLILLKLQCKGHGLNGIHRRSRLHKEFDGKWKNGIKEEIDKGYNDASNYRDVDTIIREALNEATGGTTSNAIGWMKRIPELGGSFEQMCHVPFALLTSGASYDIDQATYKHAKALWDGDGQPVIMLRMFGDKSKMDLFNETVRQLSSEIGDAYPDKYPNIKDDSKKLYQKSQSREGKEEDRINAASDFWKKYGTPLARGLHNSLESGTDTSATDTIIKRKAQKNATFGEYNKVILNAVGEGDAFNLDIVDDWAGDTGVFGLNTYKIAEKFLAMDQGGAFKKGAPSKKVWKHMYSDINSTPNKVLVGGSELDSPENRLAQKKYITTQLEEITAALLSVHGGRSGILPAINTATGHLGEQFNKWGINVANDLGHISSSQLKEGGARKYFENIAENIISGNSSTSQRTPGALVKKIKDQAAENLNDSQVDDIDDE